MQEPRASLLTHYYAAVCMLAICAASALPLFDSEAWQGTEAWERLDASQLPHLLKNTK